MKVTIVESYKGEFDAITPQAFLMKARLAVEEAMHKGGIARPQTGADGRVKALEDVERRILDTYERVTKRAVRELQRRIAKGIGGD